MARFLSREMQRQIAALALDAELEPQALDRLGKSIQSNNGTTPHAYYNFLRKDPSYDRDHPRENPQTSGSC